MRTLKEARSLKNTVKACLDDFDDSIRSISIQKTRSQSRVIVSCSSSFACNIANRLESNNLTSNVIIEVAEFI